MQQPAVYQREVTVSGENGLHIRPIHQIVKTAQQFPCTTRIHKGSQSVDATSMLDLMTLGAEQGTALVLECSGDGANVSKPSRSSSSRVSPRTRPDEASFQCSVFSFQSVVNGFLSLTPETDAF
jgi:phosphocarrier protein HPr